jgi:translocation and assembly module TamB
VEATGPLTAPQIQADLSVPQATIRPNLKLLEESPIQRDETIIIVSSPDVPESPATDEKAGLDTEEELQAIGQTETTQELSLDVQIALPRNTWIKHRNADIELAGQVHAVQTPGNALKLVGTIRVVRGWVGSQGRRFTVSQGQVVFTGGEQIDPSLDIVATYQTSDRDYTIELIIGGTAQEPTLTLQSEPPLEQADILAVLMFGKPASALGQGEKVDLQKQALSITSGYAARKIGQSVSDALGLESLGVDLREVDLTGGRVGFGHYIGDKTYVSAAQDLSGKRGREVSVDYQLSPEWNITTSTSTTGNNEAGITWQKRY